MTRTAPSTRSMHAACARAAIVPGPIIGTGCHPDALCLTIARVSARLFDIAHRLAAHTGQKCSILNRCPGLPRLESNHPGTICVCRCGCVLSCKLLHGFHGGLHEKTILCFRPWFGNRNLVSGEFRAATNSRRPRRYAIERHRRNKRRRHVRLGCHRNLGCRRCRRPGNGYLHQQLRWRECDEPRAQGRLDRRLQYSPISCSTAARMCLAPSA